MELKVNANQRDSRSRVVESAVKSNTEAMKLFSLRLTEKERQDVFRKAKKAGLSASEFMRRASSQSVVRRVLKKKELRLIKKIIALANLLSTLSKRAEEEGLLHLSMELQQITSKLDQMLEGEVYHDS